MKGRTAYLIPLAVPVGAGRPEAPRDKAGEGAVAAPGATTTLAWQIKTVDSDGTVGLSTSLALDASGWPHISYYDWTNYDLEYAYSVSEAERSI